MEVTNMSSQDAARKCSFNDFMDNIGPGRFGLMMMDTYETQHMEDAKPRSDPHLSAPSLGLLGML